MNKSGLVAPVLALLMIIGAGCAGPSPGTGDLNVLITGADDAPLAGAKVISEVQPEGQLKITGITGEDGRVTFQGIRAGEYRFYFSRYDYQQKDFTVNIVSGKSADITVSLAPAPK